MSKLKDDFIRWQMHKVGTPFVADEEFFRERYGTFLSPFCKDLFRELLETDERLARLEDKGCEPDDDD